MKQKGISIVWTIIVIVVIALAGFLAYTWLRDDDTVTITPDETANVTNEPAESTDDEATLRSIVENPEQHYGQTVTVQGEIQDLLSSRVFKISDRAAGDELHVVTRNPLTEQQLNEATELFEDNADVKVQGTLRQMTTAELETEYNIDLTAELETELTGKPILVADTYTFTDTNEVLDFTQEPVQESID